MAKPLKVTKELLASIKELASIGLNQEEISSKLGRDPATLFYNSKKKHPELVSSYYDGKRENKEKLLRDVRKLGDEAKSEDVQFKVKKYELSIHHKISEITKQEVTGKDGESLIPTAINIKIGA